MTRPGLGEWVLVSDVHLNELIVSPEPGWWEYKAKESSQDQAFADFLSCIEAQRPTAFSHTSLVFNGDTFDFDTCFATPEGLEAGPAGLAPTEAGSTFKMQRILADHPLWVSALARFLAHGNAVYFVFGNHDRELCYPGVQESIRLAFAAASPIGKGQEVAARIHFVPWFLHVPGVLYAEHGNQYDATCSYRDVLDPSVPAEGDKAAEIETPFGSLLGRHTLGRLGSFNPYNDESFIMPLSGYIAHWRRYYRGKRSFLSAYGSAVWRGLRELRERRKRQLTRFKPLARSLPKASDPLYVAYAEQTKVSLGFMERQLRLSSPPIADHVRLLLHEVWVDRFFLIFSAFVVVVGGTLWVDSWGAAAWLWLLLLPLFFAFKLMGRSSLALEERARWGLVAESIASDLKVPVVCFGHSHRPERRPLTGGGRYYNLGSWAPVLPADAGSSLARARRYLMVRPKPSGDVYVAFSFWGGTDWGTEAPAGPKDLGTEDRETGP